MRNLQNFLYSDILPRYYKHTHTLLVFSIVVSSRKHKYDNKLHVHDCDILLNLGNHSKVVNIFD